MSKCHAWKYSLHVVGEFAMKEETEERKGDGEVTFSKFLLDLPNKMNSYLWWIENLPDFLALLSCAPSFAYNGGPLR